MQHDVATDEMRIDELARTAQVPTTTIRLYRSKRLLQPPRLVGRTGYYDERHVARLELIARLRAQGFSLAGIGSLLERWQRGDDLADLVGADAQVSELLGRRHAVTLTTEELAARFPPDALRPEVVQRAASLGLIEATGDGRLRVPDTRFVETGSTLAHLGLPVDVILDEWAHLTSLTDAVAERFAALFEEHLLATGWRTELDGEQARRLASTLGELRASGEQVLLAALDDSIARLTASRFAELLPE